MSYVGVVLLSHSYDLVKGLEALLKQIQPDVPLSVAGGTESGEIGTDVFQIKKAIESVMNPKGVAILFDLGSALINAELAIEMLGNNKDIRLADAPLVEGAYAAIIQSGCGSSIEEVIKAAEGAKALNKL
ncbi:dihydroxyacetone kinase phosphoryl donor subunit DhaM [Robertmurraya andreesenii]|uniref:phosphoenolpyruvate--glycerone phosphotransferase n=1 Tax=Anoxybacillus andreesenii TaxID=1325932 RepID=A0ABT9V4C4_9BACL|nr:dihydroxyacetone kinase phosphoryl donor subunit DhaM [Robertmurraya andreesenii]MDQ0155794.1 dihydroxyacetone kinase phosphotransfer subunit [Robertmurraya andreesenii]